MEPLKLRDASGQFRTVPDRRPACIAFGKRDCPTCNLAFPVFRTFAEAYGSSLDVLWIAQDAEGATAWVDEAGPLPVLDDAALEATMRLAPEAVPTVYWVTPGADAEVTCVGFERAEWQGLSQRLAREANCGEARVDWSELPALRPGCGSRHLDPAVAATLELPPGSEHLEARHLLVADGVDEYEFLESRGLTDGLPVVPPTPARVLAMLEGTARSPDAVVATVPPNLAPITVEKIAINAVMAGCEPTYLPAVIAGVEAVCSERFNLHGVLATTFFTSPILVVNGPVRDALCMNYGGNCLGQGNRANQTIGRAVQLVVQNVGGGRPGEIDRAVMGQPGKTSFCFAEHEARSSWEPWHVERGFQHDASAVTAFAGSGPIAIVDQLSRTGRSLATSYGMTVAASMHPKLFSPDVVIIVPPEHVDTFARDGFTKDDVREVMQEASQRPASRLARDAECEEGTPDSILAKFSPDAPVAKFPSPDNIHFVVAGGEAGKFAALLQGWPAGALGSSISTAVIDADA